MGGKSLQRVGNVAGIIALLCAIFLYVLDIRSMCVGTVWFYRAVDGLLWFINRNDTCRLDKPPSKELCNQLLCQSCRHYPLITGDRKI